MPAKNLIKIPAIVLVLYGSFLSGVCFSADSALSIEDLNLSARELNWIKENRLIKIAGPRSFPPFHYYDNKGRLKGISADYIFMIMNLLGLKLEIQKDLPWSEVLKKIKSKEIDLIPCIAKTSERDSFIDFSAPFVSFPLVILSRKDAPFIGGIKDIHGKKLSLIKKNAIADWLKKDEIKFDPIFVESPVKGLEALSQGRVDVSIENLAAASYIIQTYGFTNIKIAAPTPYTNYNLHMGIRKDLPELMGIINNILESMPLEQHMKIKSKWLSVRYEHGIRKSDVLKWSLLIILTAFIIISIVFVWNKKLNNEISKRKKIIKQLEDAIAEIKTLRGIVPICSGCKKIRDDTGYWNQIESYLQKHSDAEFTHGMCPDCSENYYGNEEWYKKMKKKKGIKCR